MEAPRQGSSNPTDTPYLEPGDGSTPPELSAIGSWLVGYNMTAVPQRSGLVRWAGS